MNLVFSQNNFSKENIFFNEAIKNTVMNESNFIRIFYSNKDFILNGINIILNFKRELDQTESNSDIIYFLEDLEKYILNLFNKNKIFFYKIKDQVNFLINKLNNPNKITNSSFILKISGIWETKDMIGLTNKFIPYE